MKTQHRVFAITVLTVTILSSLLLFCACAKDASKMQDGYYTAEAASFDSFGWKEYITIYVSDDKIVTVEYDARNPSGFIKSWDMDYMRLMSTIDGTYPNEFSRTYKVGLLNWQSTGDIGVLTGATASYNSFQLLANAAISQAKAGDKQVAFVELP